MTYSQLYKLMRMVKALEQAERITKGRMGPTIAGALQMMKESYRGNERQVWEEYEVKGGWKLWGEKECRILFPWLF